MKNISIILAIAILLSSLCPCLAAEVYPSEDGTYIVKLSEDELSLAEEYGLTEIYADAGLYRTDNYDLVKKLRGSLEYYERDAKAYLIGEVEETAPAELYALTNDQYCSRQWALTNIAISSAWSRGYDGRGVRIAVIDSGVRSSHQDLLSADIIEGYNLLNGTTNAIDETGHGTFVTGVLTAAINNGIGIAGLCDRATIVPIKCFGSSISTDASYIVEAVYKAVDTYKCDIINLSLGITVNLQSLKQAIDYASGKGVIVVAAVGNSGTTDLSYPAAYSNVVGVGSIDSGNTISSFSHRNSSVCVVAPGSELISTGYSADSSYVKGNGTSFSTPHVAAAAAILKQYERSANVDDFIAILSQSSVDLGASGYDTTYGYGGLNIKSFMPAMESYRFVPKNNDPPVEVEKPGDGPVVTEPTNPMADFTDVGGHWAYDEIAYCVGRKYFNGVSKTSFAPELTMTRGMFITVIARMSGENINGYFNPFIDVPDDKYYAQPCAWAKTKGIISADDRGCFYPEQNITREQMATFLYRYAVSKGYVEGKPDLNVISSYSDYAYVSPWAAEGMAWTVKNGIINGRTATTLCPRDTAKRSEVSAIIYRFAILYKNS